MRWEIISDQEAKGAIFPAESESAFQHVLQKKQNGFTYFKVWKKVHIRVAYYSA